MSDRTLRVPLAPLAQGRVDLSADSSRYVTRVHRLGVGDRFVAFDPDAGLEADAELVEVTRRSATALLSTPRPGSHRASRRVRLVQALGKGDKMDQIVRDATELGATHIAPVIAERTVAKLDPRDSSKRAARYRRVAVEAARQCGRGDAPIIEAVLPLSDVLSRASEAGVSGFCLHPDAEEPLGTALLAVAADRGLVFVVGPEGGLSAGELAAASRAGMRIVTLGALRLRTETVCAAVLGAVLVMAGRGP